MAFLIQKLQGDTSVSFAVVGSRTGKTYSYHNTELEAQEEIKRRIRNHKAKIRRQSVKEAYESVGLVRVRGALGGVYYE